MYGTVGGRKSLQRNSIKIWVKFAAVDHIHFSIREGECLGLVGESGCGKITTASLIAGLLKPDKRHFPIFGRGAYQIFFKARIRKNIQMIFSKSYGFF